MNVKAIGKIGLLLLCAVLLPFLLDVILGVFNYTANADSPILHGCISFVIIFPLILGSLYASERLTSALELHHVMMFSLFALIVFRIEHLMVEMPTPLEVSEALVVITSCLLSFCIQWIKMRSANKKSK